MTSKDKNTDLLIELRPGGDREVEVLLHCARASIEKERAERILELVAEGLNWDRLLKLAQRNGLSPLLYFHINQVCAVNVPAEPLKFLRD